jgi:MerR family transcriptional regulator, light-induced transcriptional regulator
MAEYSIRDLENFTNIKAHTLRIWEQRYKLLVPKRTHSNIRYYSDKDLKKILNISLLYSNGWKISKIAQMSEQEIIGCAANLLLSGERQAADHVDDFVKQIVDLDEEQIVSRLQHLGGDIGMERLYDEILVPLLKRIGDLWQVEAINVSHEHFFSNILREFIILETTKLPVPKKPIAKIVLFLHEGEQHELSLLYYSYYLKKRNYACTYLGQRVPLKDLRLIVEQIRPDYLFTNLIADITDGFLTEWIAELTSFFPRERIFIGGYQALQHKKNIPLPINKITATSDINDLLPGALR